MAAPTLDASTHAILQKVREAIGLQVEARTTQNERLAAAKVRTFPQTWRLHS